MTPSEMSAISVWQDAKRDLNIAATRLELAKDALKRMETMHFTAKIQEEKAWNQVQQVIRFGKTT